MTAQEIQERNKEIALMLGGYKCSKISEQYELPKFMTFPPKGRSNLCHTAKVCLLEDMQFHSDWNWLMESVEFIKKNIKTSNDTQDAKIGELFVDEWKLGVKQYYLRIIQWTENGWRMFDGKENSELSMFYIIGENCESEKEAVFLIVSDFAKLYNDKKL